jgi:DNA-binding transcriptional LysR family regulator
MHFTLKQLRYFTAAGEYGSVTQAAELLYVSQPSISSAIMHLEEVMGLKLFIRHHAQGLSLTPQGQKFFNQAKKLLSQADALAKFADTLGHEVSGNLKLVGFPTFTSLLMPMLMRQFIEKYKNVTIECDEMHQRDLIRNIVDSHYEMGITYDMELPDTIAFYPLASLPPYVAVSEEHSLADRCSISLEELEPYPMVMLDWPISRQYFTSLFLNKNLKPNLAYRSQSVSMVRGMVANGFGYTLLNTPITEDSGGLERSRLMTIPLEGEVTTLTMGVATLQQNQLSPAGEAFLEILKDFAVTTTTLSPPIFNQWNFIYQKAS